LEIDRPIVKSRLKLVVQEGKMIDELIISESINQSYDQPVCESVNH
jgi:hypothetical protein